VSVLSGGEKSRLALVKLLLDPPNLLLMDEPTTHLDMASIEALISALQQYSGTLLFISHDVYFIRQLSSHVVRVEAGRLTHYSGGYQYYLEKMAALAAAAGSVAVPSAVQSKEKSQKRLEAEERQARSRERKNYQAAVAQLEKEIQQLESRHKELTAELENPATYEEGGRAMRVNREWQETERRLKELSAEWEQVALQLAETEKA